MNMRISMFASCALACGLAPVVGAQTPSVTVPLVVGLAVVGSVREPAGDYESVRRVTGIASDRVAFVITAERPPSRTAAAFTRSSTCR